jgi:hypothetical protein
MYCLRAGRVFRKSLSTNTLEQAKKKSGLAHALHI